MLGLNNEDSVEASGRMGHLGGTKQYQGISEPHQGVDMSRIYFQCLLEASDCLLDPT